MRIEDVSHQALVLSNEVENGFPGKLWSCTSCKDKNDERLMKGFTTNKTYKSHKKTPSCSLYNTHCLPNTKTQWGKNLDYQRTGYDKEYVYAQPTKLRPAQQKKSTAPTSSHQKGLWIHKLLQFIILIIGSSPAPIPQTMGPADCVTCKNTEHRCISCKEKCCALCKVSGELNKHVCKNCSSSNDPSKDVAPIPDNKSSTIEHVISAVRSVQTGRPKRMATKKKTNLFQTDSDDDVPEPEYDSDQEHDKEYTQEDALRDADNEADEDFEDNDVLPSESARKSRPKQKQKGLPYELPAGAAPLFNQYRDRRHEMMTEAFTDDKYEAEIKWKPTDDDVLEIEKCVLSRYVINV